jgi:undecaprenyl-diphosphatase
MSLEQARVEPSEESRDGVASLPSWPVLPIMVAALASVLVALVSLDVGFHGRLSRLDLRIARWAFEDVSAGTHTWVGRLTHLGDSQLLAVVVVVAVAWLLLRRRSDDALLLCLGAGLTGLLTTLLKLAFHRSRPPYIEDHAPRTFSFPSGHSSGAFCVYVLVALLLTVGARRRWQALAVTAALALGLLVATTRVLIPVHYLTDVLAGSGLGLAVVAVAWLARVAYARRR